MDFIVCLILHVRRYDVECILRNMIFIFDDVFFNRTGLERVGVVGPEPGLLLDWSVGFSVVLPCKDKKEEG